MSDHSRSPSLTAPSSRRSSIFKSFAKTPDTPKNAKMGHKTPETPKSTKSSSSKTPDTPRASNNNAGKMAVFRKILSGTKKPGGGGKGPDLKFQAKRGGTSTALPDTEDEQFEKRKQEWQSELEQMSEFLVIKSTQEQKEEGTSQPVDSAFIEDKDGMPFLKALFDVRHFGEEDISVKIEDQQLVMTAQNLEDRDDRTYTRTIIRRVDLPKHVDTKMMHTEFRPDDGLFSVEMPFHLPPSKKPEGPNIFPIVTDEEGRKKIRVVVFIGPDFSEDDVIVETTTGKNLSIRAAYDAEIGKYGRQVQQRDFRRDYVLPEHLEAERVDHVLAADGRLLIDIHLKDDRPYRCTISAEELPQ